MSITLSKVYLVGVGPGDPRLITRRAEKLIKEADIILYDRLVNPFILQLAKKEADIISVGKTPYQPQIKQETINRLLIEHSKTSNNIVRLKGGDPSIFGRVDEEIEALIENNVQFEVVPGITTASAAVAYQSHGLTKRGTATQVTFVTGHFEQAKHHELKIDTILCGGTIAVYMGLKRLSSLIEEIKFQSKIDYDIAVITNVSLASQQTLKGKISNILNIVNKNTLEGPAIILIGKVVMNETTSWFEGLPKFGRKILLKGKRHEVIDKAWEFYDQGAWCFIESTDNNLSKSQKEFETQIIENNKFDEIIN